MQKSPNELLVEAGCKKKSWIKISEFDWDYTWIPHGHLIAKGACIGHDYLDYLAPEKGKTKVFSTVTNQKIRSVNAEEETIALDLSMTMRWLDPHIKTNFSHEDVKNGGITLEPHLNNYHIWIPDWYIFNLRNFKSFESQRIKSLTILTDEMFSDLRSPNTTRKRTLVEMKTEIKSTVYCDFSHTAYPLDEQNCELRFGSSSLGAILSLYDPYKTYHPKNGYEAAKFDISVTFFDEKQNSGNNTIGIGVKMKRILNPFIWKYYIPCTTIVVVSSLSFAIPVTAIPGRVALLVTQFLTLINLFIYQMASNHL